MVKRIMCRSERSDKPFWSRTDCISVCALSSAETISVVAAVCVSLPLCPAPLYPPLPIPSLLAFLCHSFSVFSHCTDITIDWRDVMAARATAATSAQDRSDDRPAPDVCVLISFQWDAGQRERAVETGWNVCGQNKEWKGILMRLANHNSN